MDHARSAELLHERALPRADGDEVRAAASIQRLQARVLGAVVVVHRVDHRRLEQARERQRRGHVRVHDVEAAPVGEDLLDGEACVIELDVRLGRPARPLEARAQRNRSADARIAGREQRDFVTGGSEARHQLGDDELGTAIAGGGTGTNGVEIIAIRIAVTRGASSAPDPAVFAPPANTPENSVCALIEAAIDVL